VEWLRDRDRTGTSLTRIALYFILTVALSVEVVAALPGSAGSNGPTSAIVDFSPTSFPVKAETGFFYSIDKDLKYSDHLDPQAPTLVKGAIGGYLISPDGNKIAAVVNKRLLIIGATGVIGDVAKINGELGYRNFQWSADSKALYFNVTNRRSNGPPGELWKYDVGSKSASLVVKSFPAWSFFLDQKSNVYSAESIGNGDVGIKMFDGHASRLLKAGELQAIDRPFYSFPAPSDSDSKKALAWLNVRLDHKNDLEHLVINDRTYLSVTLGKGWDGYYYCSRHMKGVFLPGNKYFAMELPYCDNYNGWLLFDLDSGRYQTIPPKTFIFGTLNTATFDHFRVDDNGIEILRKTSEWEIRQAALKAIEISAPFVVREVNGTISSTTGQPLGNGSFTMCRNNVISSGTTTGDDGKFSFTMPRNPNPVSWPFARAMQPPPGTYGFKVVRAGYHPAIGTFVISPDATKTSALDIRLEFGFDVEADAYHWPEIGRTCR